MEKHEYREYDMYFTNHHRVVGFCHNCEGRIFLLTYLTARKGSQVGFTLCNNRMTGTRRIEDCLPERILISNLYTWVLC